MARCGPRGVGGLQAVVVIGWIADYDIVLAACGGVRYKGLQGLACQSDTAGEWGGGDIVGGVGKGSLVDVYRCDMGCGETLGHHEGEKPCPCPYVEDV